MLSLCLTHTDISSDISATTRIHSRRHIPHFLPVFTLYCKSRGIQLVLWRFATEPWAADTVEVRHMIFNTVQIFLRRDTLMWVCLCRGPLSYTRSCLQVLTQRASQIPTGSCSCHRNWMSRISCCAANSRQFSKQLHADSTFDLVACQCKCFKVLAYCLCHLL